MGGGTSHPGHPSLNCSQWASLLDHLQHFGIKICPRKTDLVCKENVPGFVGVSDAADVPDKGSWFGPNSRGSTAVMLC